MLASLQWNVRNGLLHKLPGEAWIVGLSRNSLSRLWAHGVIHEHTVVLMCLKGSLEDLSIVWSGIAVDSPVSGSGALYVILS